MKKLKKFPKYKIPKWFWNKFRNLPWMVICLIIAFLLSVLLLLIVNCFL